ncbi:ABC-type transport system, permease and ATPse components [Alteracholeplasma palmae J233]|uniref:ABC-type transport system, permease and ATPse components n=1 Tax=Alteracholeplasma palmae (strain ATCC 49389 / J233) TaxID=1318466 RepID=U4KQL1_ALTPJ|nr:ABC transporter ATP-binding protein [Alteracholeplasma palmae]CCV64770.1 ABC-type transport system, permease and ATPse components [Alteracholeplasma palmae J233]
MKRIKQLFKLLKGNIWLFLFAIILTIVHRMTYSYVPLFTQYLIKALENQNVTASDVNLPAFILNFLNQYKDILQIVVATIAVLLTWQIARFISLYVESRVKGNLQENVSRKLRIGLYDHIQDLSYEYHNNVDSGDLIQRVTSDVDTTTSFVAMRSIDFIGLIATLSFGSYQMYFINPTIMWISLAIIPITAVASIWYFFKIDKLFKKVEEKESEVMVVIQENVSAARVVRAFANEKYEVSKLESKNSAFRDTEIKATKLVAVYWGSMDFLMMLQFLAVILLGVYYASKGIMDVSSVSSALMLVGMLIWPVRGLGRMINDFGKALVASDRIEHIFQQEKEYKNDGEKTPEIKGHIIFKDVSFKFPDGKEHLLDKINFEILPGETVAFIGKTGSGKSTIINLLLRMYDYEGSITIDGIELKEIKKQYIRKNIGTVLQDPFLYSKTVYQNISIANPLVNNEQVIKAATIAALEKDIKTFKNGYETVVGEQGTTLSGGQKQRVAIARILISDKPILIFDDALSALDNKTDLAIRKALKKEDKDRTTIIITHRITTAKETNKIIVLNDGRVEAVGTHSSLSKKEGLYKKLWAIQGALEEEFLKLVKEGEKE